MCKTIAGVVCLYIYIYRERELTNVYKTAYAYVRILYVLHDAALISEHAKPLLAIRIHTYEYAKCLEIFFSCVSAPLRNCSFPSLEAVTVL